MFANRRDQPDLRAVYKRSTAHPASTYAGSGGFIAPQRSRIVKCIGGESGPSQYKIICHGCIRLTSGSAGTSGEVVDYATTFTEFSEARQKLVKNTAFE